MEDPNSQWRNCHRVRALLVDKDKSPKWSKSSVFDVKKEDADLFFEREAVRHTNGQHDRVKMKPRHS